MVEPRRPNYQGRPQYRSKPNIIKILQDRIYALEKEVRSLKDLLNVHNNWHSTISKWIDCPVTVKSCNGDETDGLLKWSDRYSFMLEKTDPYDPKQITKVMFSKGGIVSISRVDDNSWE